MKQPLLLFGLMVLVAGCRPSPPASTSPGFPYSAEDLKLERPGWTRARLVLKGSELTADLVVSKGTGAGSVNYELQVGGRSLEIEKYSREGSVIRYLGSDVDSFLPAIELFRTPLDLAEETVWNGEVLTFGEKREANAIIKRRAMPLNAVGGPYPALEVLIELTINNGERAPARRRLAFILTPGQGVIVRDFNSSSTRRPAP